MIKSSSRLEVYGLARQRVQVGHRFVDAAVLDGEHLLDLLVAESADSLNHPITESPSYFQGLRTAAMLVGIE